MSTLLEFLDSDNDKVGNFPEKEWVNMPEFVSEKVEPYAKIIVRFDNEQDLKEFSEMIGQKVNVKTKSIWHPQLDRGKNGGLRWVEDDKS
jgi:hypothetical protein